MKSFILIPVVVMLLVFAGGCNIVNPAEVIPTYVRIDSFAFQGNTGITGSNSHRITSVFAFLNNQSIGIFDLPITFPIIMEQPGKLMMTPGINYNGMASYQVQYPFYLSDTITLQPNPVTGETKIVAPVARYYPNLKFPFRQDFENYLSAPFVNAGSDTSITVSTATDGLEGKYGLITVNSPNDSSVNITRDGFSLPANAELYLEMDYKSNIPLTVGLQTTFNGELKNGYILGLNPRPDSWGKVYIDLRTFASTFQGGPFYLLLRAVRTDVSNGYVMVDNLKIVHF